MVSREADQLMLDRCFFLLREAAPDWFVSPKVPILLDCQLTTFLISAVSRMMSSFIPHLSIWFWHTRRSYLVLLFSISSAWCLRQCSWSSIVTCSFAKWSTNSSSFTTTFVCRALRTEETLAMLVASAVSAAVASVRLVRLSTSSLSSSSDCFILVFRFPTVFSAARICRDNSSRWRLTSRATSAVRSFDFPRSAYTWLISAFRMNSSSCSCLSVSPTASSTSKWSKSAAIFWMASVVKSCMRLSTSGISTAMRWICSCKCAWSLLF
mmetsp:Transcript_75733/g.214065  ORF Transcript_75733/g.214065 Transcript_75733/m.214065 type:complete len:267 (+) Transcript_75733:767-1567(+)